MCDLKMPYSGSRRKFNGKYYTLKTRDWNKTIAKADVKRLRKRGYKVRMVKDYSGDYTIWVRKT